MGTRGYSCIMASILFIATSFPPGSTTGVIQFSYKFFLSVYPFLGKKLVQTPLQMKDVYYHAFLYLA